MAAPANLTEFLASRTPEQLATILRHRPDVRRGAPITGLANLAARLADQSSTYAAITNLPMPGIQLLHAAIAAGAAPTHERLLTILAFGDRPAAQQHAAVDAVVGELQDRALAWPLDDGTLLVEPAVAGVIDHPMNIGMTVRAHLDQVGRYELERMCAQWHLPYRGGQAANRSRLAAVLTDPDRVQAVVAGAPRRVQEYLTQLAVTQLAGTSSTMVRPRETKDGETWARQHGLVFGGDYYLVPELPVEVLMAVGPGMARITFEPDPPADLTRPVDAAVVRTAAAAAAGEFTQSVAALADRLSRTPAAELKAGGIGNREVSKIAKALDVADAQVRFGLELLRDLDLLAGVNAAVGVAPAVADWRGADPADRYCDLATVWWGLPIHPTIDRDDEGKPIPAVGRRAGFGSAAELRAATLTLAAELPDGVGIAGPAELDRWLAWLRPALAARSEDVAAIWQEAHTLGLLVGGALSPLGRPLLAADPAALLDVATDLLAPASSTGRFGSDLTVVVAGAPSAAVSALLDTCADREGRGAAVIWRFSPASVRRAFDEGWTADELAAALLRVADGQPELPQPLTYLIADVARRHGHLVVLPAVCCVRSADPALLAEVVAHRSLQRLLPHLVTPQVATFQHSPAAVVEALRAAGYLPVPADEHGVVDLGRAPDHDSRPARRAAPGTAAPGTSAPGTAAADRLRGRSAAGSESAAETVALAAGLLRTAGVDDRSWPTSTVAEWIGPLTDQLTDVERHQLAHAIEHQTPVTITYHAGTGGFSTRTISELELVGDQLFAWCHLREDQRVFKLDRIIGVVAVGG